MSDNLRPTILVIVGITGDLSRRKLLPAVQAIARAGVLPEHFKIIGISRREVTAAEVLHDLPDVDFLENHLEMYTMDLTDQAAYVQLKQYLDTVEQEFGGTTQRLFYLSIPPQSSTSVVELVGKSGLAARKDTKLLLEKPFGVDFASARDLIAETSQYFDESQLYRIDHYLAKEMTQNIVVFRAANILFKETWSNQFIDSIEIQATEKIDIEGRAAFYEQTGALRDLVQSHLMQLAALTLIPRLNIADQSMIPAQRLDALRALKIAEPASVIRAQYQGYAEEVGNPNSQTETFVDLTLVSSDPNWAGVPIRLVTGKALGSKTTEIRITYKQTEMHGANQLTFRIQPEEGVDFCIWTKEPGYDGKIHQLPLKYIYEDHYDSLPEAYEQVLLNAIRSDHLLFTSSDEVLESWRILEPVLRLWHTTTDDKPQLYPRGSSVSDIVGLLSPAA